MALLIMFISGLCVALGNLAMRKSIDHGGKTHAYLSIQLSLSMLVALLVYPVRTGNYAFDPNSAILGVITGIILIGMMITLGKALANGPPGLTIAFINGSTVVPAIIMFLIFGASLGFVYTSYNAIGSFFVLLGLFWAGSSKINSENKTKWLSLTLAAFTLHVLLLCSLQYRAFLLFTDLDPSASFLIPFKLDLKSSEWFLPLMFLVASVTQALIFFFAERRLPKKEEVLYGVFGGIVNGISIAAMLKATELATPFEGAMMFPLYSVSIICICNLWGKLLYNEEINWKANLVAIAGLIIGTVQWSSL